MTMKQLPDEKTLLEILELARDFEQSTREMCEMSTAIAHKYQKTRALHLCGMIWIYAQNLFLIYQ